MTSLAGLRSRIGPGFHSEEWSKGMLKLPALATWHLLCHLTLGWPLYKSEPVLSRKTYLGQPGRMNHWPRAVGHCRQALR